VGLKSAQAGFRSGYPLRWLEIGVWDQGPIVANWYPFRLLIGVDQGEQICALTRNHSDQDGHRASGRVSLCALHPCIFRDATTCEINPMNLEAIRDLILDG
jgi:hypothetical protein